MYRIERIAHGHVVYCVNYQRALKLEIGLGSGLGLRLELDQCFEKRVLWDSNPGASDSESDSE